MPAGIHSCVLLGRENANPVSFFMRITEEKESEIKIRQILEQADLVKAKDVRVKYINFNKIIMVFY